MYSVPPIFQRQNRSLTKSVLVMIFVETVDGSEIRQSRWICVRVCVLTNFSCPYHRWKLTRELFPIVRGLTHRQLLPSSWWDDFKGELLIFDNFITKKSDVFFVAERTTTWKSRWFCFFKQNEDVFFVSWIFHLESSEFYGYKSKLVEKKPLVKMPIMVEEWVRILRVFAAGFVIHSRSWS